LRLGRGVTEGRKKKGLDSLGQKRGEESFCVCREVRREGTGRFPVHGRMRRDCRE
jgi:hypothetical protein